MEADQVALEGPEDLPEGPLDQVDLVGPEAHCPDLLGDRLRHWGRSVRSVVLLADDRAAVPDDPEAVDDRPENDRPDRRPGPWPERQDLGPERERRPRPRLLLLERERLRPRDGARERRKAPGPPRWVVRPPRGGPVDWPDEPRSPRS